MKKYLLTFFCIAFFSYSYAQNNNSISASDSVLAIAEKMPEFKGGQSAMYQYLVSNLAWPDVSADKIYKASITVGFIVTKEGKIKKTRIVKGAHPKLDAEALRVFSAMPDWNPGMNKGKAVNVFINLPLTYKSNIPPPVEETPAPVKAATKKKPMKKGKKK
jgi:hypothetical protein